MSRPAPAGGFKAIDDTALRTLLQRTLVPTAAGVENLFDERYETVFRYGSPGRAGYAGVRLRY